MYFNPPLDFLPSLYYLLLETFLRIRGDKHLTKNEILKTSGIRRQSSFLEKIERRKSCRYTRISLEVFEVSMSSVDRFHKSLVLFRVALFTPCERRCRFQGNECDLVLFSADCCHRVTRNAVHTRQEHDTCPILNASWGLFTPSNERSSFL